MEYNGRIKLNGNTIKRLRSHQCLSREMFSSKSQQMGCYLSVSTLKRAEAGNKIYYRTAQDIASILKVSLEELQDNDIKTSSDDHKPVITKTISRHEQIHRAISTFTRTKTEKKGSIIFIQGEAGIGKSHFIQNITDQAEELEFINFYLPIYDGVTKKRQLLQDLISKFIQLGNHELEFTDANFINTDHSINLECLKKFAAKEKLDYNSKRALFTLFEQMPSSPTQTHHSDQKNHELDLVFSLIKNLSYPINIILEDIHWASTDIINIVQKLTHEARNHPLVIILSSRLINNPIYQIWNSTVLNTRLELVNLCPLNQSELGSIKNIKLLPIEKHNSFIKLSNGNPLFLKYLIEIYSKGREQNLPHSLNSLVKEELSNLNADEIDFLYGASILGHEFNLEELKEIFQIEDFDPKELIKYNFFQKNPNNNYTFKHDLIRQSIYQNISKKEKILLHEKASDFYQDKDKLKLTLHLRKSQKAQKALSEIEAFAQDLYEKHDFCESLNQVDIALSIPGKKNLFSLYYMKGVLLKVLDLPAKATQYLEKALLEKKTTEQELQICIELTEIYAVNQRFELSQNYLTKTKSLLTGKESAETKKKINKYQNYLKKCSFSLNSNHTKIQYQQSKEFKTSIQNLGELPSPSKNSTLAQEHKVALLHSISGPLKEHEEGVIKSCVMAFEEINKNGGLLDHHISYEIFDGKSNEHIFREQAELIIREHQLTSIFGCSTSSTRKQVKSVVENSQSLLIYPFHYEGIESSDKIIYTGPTSNLQALPIIDWINNNTDSKSFYFVGSDYVYPVVTNEILRDSIQEYEGRILGEDYFPVGSIDFNDVIDNIKKTKPDVIILTLASLESNKAFLRIFYEAELNRDGGILLVSLVLSDCDINQIPVIHCQGLYSIFSYFQNHDNYTNDDFIQRFKHRYGKNERIGGYMESAYVGVKLWAMAIQKCQSFCSEKISESIKGLSYYGPGGIAYIDEDNHHVWRHSHIAQVGTDGEFHIQWTSEQPIAPFPYPLSRSKSEWESFLKETKTRWEGSWGI